MPVCLQDRARKQLEAQIADENRRIALAKSLERQQQRQTEVEQIRQQMQQVGLLLGSVMSGLVSGQSCTNNAYLGIKCVRLQPQTTLL